MTTEVQERAGTLTRDADAGVKPESLQTNPNRGFLLSVTQSKLHHAWGLPIASFLGSLPQES